MLRKKSNEEIHTNPSLRYGKDALCQRTVYTWAARFRSGRTSVEGDDKPGGLSFNALSAAVSSYLENNLTASCREIAKDLFVPKTIIPRVLEEIASRFFSASWVPDELSAESKTNRVDIGGPKSSRPPAISLNQ
jgi:hypothetical protein